MDKDPKMGATIQVDILEWQFWDDLRPGEYEVVFAAPPCTEYSQALTSRPRRMDEADEVIKRTLQVIMYLRPALWFLENPATGRLKSRGLLDNFASVTLDYCRFAPWGYRKPTQVWATVQHCTNQRCDPQCCPNMTLQEVMGRPKWRHRVKLEGGIVPLREKYRIPPHLVEYVMGWGGPPSVHDLEVEVERYLETEPVQ